MTTKAQLKPANKIVSQHEFGNVCFNPVTQHLSFHSIDTYMPGEIMINKFYNGTTQNYATYLTIQIGTNKHVFLDPVYLQYINHSCDPNVFFDTHANQMVCIKPILPGEEIVFFYPSTEWEMAQPFICNCGSKNCLQFIGGAAQMDTETLTQYRLSDFILQQIKL